MEQRRYRTPRKIYSTFKLIGDVIKNNDASVLVQKANTFNQFWLDKVNFKHELEEGKRYSFDVTISTYLDKSDKAIRTKLRTVDCYQYDDELGEDEASFMGIKEGTIENFFPTDINSLKIVVFRNKKTDELFYLRYFADKDPELGDCTLVLDLRSTSKAIHEDGSVWDLFRNYTDKDGTEKEVKRWVPSLEITDFI